MTGGVVTRAAGGTGWVLGHKDPRSIGVEETAEAGTRRTGGRGEGKVSPSQPEKGGL